jgi:hypothetical protein
MFIDADSNQKLAGKELTIKWKIAARMESGREHYMNSHRLGKRILNETKNYTAHFYEKNNNYVTLYADLSAMGSPDKYRVMFYAEELKGTTNNPIFWVDDYTSWIDIPRPQFSLLTMPSHIVLRPGEGDSYGIQLTSNTTLVPQVSNFTVKENTSNMQLKFITNPSYNSYSSMNQNLLIYLL